MAASADATGAVRTARGPSSAGARKRALTVAGLVAAAAGVVWLGAPVCPTALFFGVPCPGCGLTRATLALANGDLAGAFHFHPLAPILAPLFIGAMGKALFEYVRGPTLSAARAPSFWSSRPGNITAAVLLVLVLGVWALRFAGYFGGPVPVESLADLQHRLRD